MTTPIEKILQSFEGKLAPILGLVLPEVTEATQDELWSALTEGLRMLDMLECQSAEYEMLTELLDPIWEMIAGEWRES